MTMDDGRETAVFTVVRRLWSIVTMTGFAGVIRLLFLKEKIALVPLVDGDPMLLNLYHVMVINPAKFFKVNHTGVRAFAAFLISSATQQQIRIFGVDQFGSPLFFPDAE